MDKYIITEEEQETVKLYTARSLPNNPSERGMKPDAIKVFFWKFLEPLFKVLNEHLGKIESGITNAVSEHDASKIAHEYILKLINDLQVQNVEQGTAITEHYNGVKQALSNLSSEIDGDVGAHDTSKSAHSDIRALINNALEKANNAYNLASGKAKVYPVSDAEEMISLLSDELNIGDKFVIAEAKVPDFTLFAKNYEYDNQENVDDISQENIHTYQFKVGRNYFYDGYLLVPSESGIDTSLFATAIQLQMTEAFLSEMYDEFIQYQDEMAASIGELEPKATVRTETAEAVMLANDTEFNLGLRTSVILNLPVQIPSDYECIVNFRSGATATSFDSPDEIIFTQDDCLDGKLYPVSNRIYEINIKRVGEYIIAKVGACDYAIL